MIYLFKVGFLEVNLLVILDIALVSILLFQVYKLMKGSIAVKIFMGFLVLYLIFLVVRAVQMELLSSILGQFMEVGFLAMIILFTPEIRKFLLVIGKTAPTRLDTFFKNIFRAREKNPDFNISPIIEACKTLAGANTGALIVFSKSSELKFYAESGDIINADPNKRLLMSIFSKESPLHDGAAIIHQGKIRAARCILPVSENSDIEANLGLRHRAAIGMSELTDTLVVAVSEETGQISVALNGALTPNVSAKELRQQINDYLYLEPQKISDEVKDSADDSKNATNADTRDTEEGASKDKDQSKTREVVNDTHSEKITPSHVTSKDGVEESKAEAKTEG